MMAYIIFMSNFNPRSRKGATISDSTMSALLSISIHAPARERRTALVVRHHCKLFQSTLPQGSDVLRVTEGAKIAAFQSTLPQGSDSSTELSELPELLFQSTLPQGSDATLK